MTRASISISPPNDEWIQAQIESQESSSRSFSVFNSHSIYYRIEPERVFIVRILGKQDLFPALVYPGSD